MAKCLSKSIRQSKPEYIYEFIWRDRNADTPAQTTENIILSQSWGGKDLQQVFIYTYISEAPIC